MPNEETIARIEELRKICDPHEKEANLVLELKQISDKIVTTDQLKDHLL